ncbi:MAG TPA: TlpA disulfide reductase family protein [Gaiellaceae bacterium]|nr:TlpA disulfide reductase family protein [Gaiellaceae bacterium]
MRFVRVAVAAGVLALLGLLIWDVVHGPGAGVAQKVDTGKIVPAPKLDLPRLNGQGNLSLASLRGKVVVINFWQSDCLPCKQEAKTLDATARAWRSKGVVFLGVDALDFTGPARAYLKHYGVSYVNVRDATGGTYPGWGVTGTPETFFVDRRGNVVPPHIISVASRQALDDGIRRALSS